MAEEQTTQWSKEKVQKDKQRSTKHTHKTKGRVTRTPLLSTNKGNNKIIELRTILQRGSQKS
jgi:hypothetical protein